MANSKYDYVRNFENPHHLLLNTYIILRLDGRCFTKFAESHDFRKPNDPRAIHLMNASASATMRTILDIAIAFGESDEFSFLLPRECALFDRREEKLITTVVSTFTGWYVFLWPQYFAGGVGGEGEQPLLTPPCFDCRATCYPLAENVRHYFSWRQVDTHINNLNNTTFWTLVLKGGLGRQEAADELRKTSSADKNEILFSQFGINYNNEPAMYRKGSVWKERQREEEQETTAVPKLKSKTQRKKEEKRARKAKIVIEHVDIIGDEF
ncbi:Thg1 C terminal domain-domain-containing protein [Tuber borchii]|uniref:tRNA(His) guanylyltransferase n=1 Tax=Tuber borchii TaxID=42251 RepID=A0A2T6ZF23_TUBBO|nr:Thg1 C terminal domain-domain-containing protein [Tuber borchii]